MLAPGTALAPYRIVSQLGAGGMGERSAVHSGFGQHFANSGRTDPRFHRCLIKAFGARVQVTEARAAETVGHAEEFPGAGPLLRASSQP